MDIQQTCQQIIDSAEDCYHFEYQGEGYQHHCILKSGKKNRKKMSTFTFYKYNANGRIPYHNMIVNIKEMKIKFIKVGMPLVMSFIYSLFSSLFPNIRTKPIFANGNCTPRDGQY